MDLPSRAPKGKPRHGIGARGGAPAPLPYFREEDLGPLGQRFRRSRVPASGPHQGGLSTASQRAAAISDFEDCVMTPPSCVLMRSRAAPKTARLLRRPTVGAGEYPSMLLRT